MFILEKLTILRACFDDLFDFIYCHKHCWSKTQFCCTAITIAVTDLLHKQADSHTWMAMIMINWNAHTLSIILWRKLFREKKRKRAILLKHLVAKQSTITTYIEQNSTNTNYSFSTCNWILKQKQSTN
jgi:uncharacterized membrane protein YwaF